MYNALTIITIILFYLTFITLLLCYFTKNQKFKPILITLIILTLISFTIWGYYRNIELPQWVFK